MKYSSYALPFVEAAPADVLPGKTKKAAAVQRASAVQQILQPERKRCLI